MVRPIHRAGESGGQLEHQEDKLHPFLHALGPAPMSRGGIGDRSYMVENQGRPRGEDNEPAEDKMHATLAPDDPLLRGRVRPHHVRLPQLEGMEV